MCDGEFLSHAPTVRFIGHLAGSTASVVDQTTFAAGVRVSSCNRLMAEHVAEWSLMMTLTATRNLLDNSSLGREHTLRFGQKLELPDPAHLTARSARPCCECLHRSVFRNCWSIPSMPLRKRWRLSARTRRNRWNSFLKPATSCTCWPERPGGIWAESTSRFSNGCGRVPR